ncbi:carboxymuconolactone decarboxylase family protein [Pseudomonas sp. St290]|jgi:4-carboxymuconolactone decarboxylase|uniref:carboxymuconolactone decarboxylase family protein n=1 Tax=unclassified Pseudomonas TaxID=196821 RepID=UPI000D6D242F|nr:4-carboxymuconolactone decarboxylase [Pseudomonas sp. St290]
MIIRTFAAAGLALCLSACATPEGARTKEISHMSNSADIHAASPVMAHNAGTLLLGEVWKRPELSPRDRSLATVAVLIARGQTTELAAYLDLALKNGVTPLELSETINHLAFYSGWGNAAGAAPIAKEVFSKHGIASDQLAPVSPVLLPIDQAAEDARVAAVDKSVGPVSPGLVKFTTSALFNDLWLRPGLAPRDRSLITVTTLVANGQVAQIGYHLNRAMDNGLTQTEACELLSHLAFYAGWPNAFSAVPVFSDVFTKRQAS